MPDRLAELRRQRALIADHLAWLDREIEAAASTSMALEPASQPATPKLPLAPAAILAAVQPAPATTVSPESDAHTHLLPEHQQANVKQDVRRGCFLYFALAALFVAVGCALLVWASQVYKKSHPPKPRPAQVESQ
jgi:hypothetical protein